jgi:hypothetical protein
LQQARLFRTTPHLAEEKLIQLLEIGQSFEYPTLLLDPSIRLGVVSKLNHDSAEFVEG